MSLQAKKSSQRRRKPDPDKLPASPARPRAAGTASHGNVGDALRSVYQRTVDEDIPPEMLDLLGKLG